MKHGSLFSGIGGFDLAAEWMGWENVFHCEWNEFGQRVLKYYWPNAVSYADITKTDFTRHRGAIDILSGGFPCQPYSVAGKRKGKEDDRHLWPEMLRAIREIQPCYVVGENVSGLVSWNGGLVFHEVQTDLENEGYEVQPFILPACAKNAPHRRDRVWFVAFDSKCKSNGKNNTRKSEGKRMGVEGHQLGAPGWVKSSNNSEPSDIYGNTSNANSEQRCKGRLHAPEPEKAERHFSSRNARSHKRGEWQNFPTQPPVCNGDDGLSGRLDGITFPKWRNESIKAGGNAIVPQVAFEIFKAIQEIHLQLSH